MEFSSAEKNSSSGLTPKTKGQLLQRILVAGQSMPVHEDVVTGVLTLHNDVH